MFFSYKAILTVLAVFCILFTQAHPLYEDSEGAATGDDHHGRVQIKVYRGPTTHEGHDHFAPWGYWVKQPADNEAHH